MKSNEVALLRANLKHIIGKSVLTTSNKAFVMSCFDRAVRTSEVQTKGFKTKPLLSATVVRMKEVYGIPFSEIAYLTGCKKEEIESLYLEHREDEPKSKKQMKAIEARANGETFQDIANKLNVPKSSVVRWVKEFEGEYELKLDQNERS